MKPLLILICSLLSISCASNHVVDLTTPTDQQQDLQDYDKDGVVKAREKCDDTLLGAKIDNDGCPTQYHTDKNIELVVNFDNNSFFVAEQFTPEIKQLANFMKAFPQSQIAIEGHCSRVGTQQQNQILSQNRALAIAQILIERFNIEQQRITTVGYGFSQPVNNGQDEAAHQQNRRILARLNGTDQATNMKWTIYTVDQQE